MPANRFATDRIVVGHEQDARIIDRVLQAILGRWPIEKCDIASVFSAAIDWSDGSTVPAENINVDELFNNATGIAAALGCMDFLNGLNVGYVDGTTISVGPGHVMHRGDFKRHLCTDGVCTEIGASVVVDTDGCAPVEGNPSGLDSDMWYFVYANMNAAGPTPPLTEFIRICDVAPVRCEGKGWENPDTPEWRFIGSIRTMDTGVIRPFIRANNGWVYWLTAAAASDYQAAGYQSHGTAMTSSGGFVRYEATVTGVAYHDGDKHISPVADLCTVAVEDDSDDPSTNIRVRPLGDSGEGHSTKGQTFTQDIRTPLGLLVSTIDINCANGSEYTLPVNMCGASDVDKQTFEWKDLLGGEKLDVTGYHERLQ